MLVEHRSCLPVQSARCQSNLPPALSHVEIDKYCIVTAAAREFGDLFPHRLVPDPIENDRLAGLIIRPGQDAADKRRRIFSNQLLPKILQSLPVHIIETS